MHDLQFCFSSSLLLLKIYFMNIKPFMYQQMCILKHNFLFNKMYLFLQKLFESSDLNLFEQLSDAKT